VDHRDDRGKKHELAFVLLSFSAAIFRSVGKISFSSLHRMMQRAHDFLVAQTGAVSSCCISRVQLMRVLEKLNANCINNLNQVYFSGDILHQDHSWQAVDGKELRGSIDKASGAKRGENVVFAVNHLNGQSQILGYYSGQKDSEKALVRDHFRQKTALIGQAYSFDALHCHPGVLAQINRKKGFYLAQVKGNQPILAEDLTFQEQVALRKGCLQSVEKAHGRIEQRKASLYEVEIDCLEPRWRKANVQSMVVIERETERCKTTQKSYEKAYYISNMTAHTSNGTKLFKAIRGHWRVESNNYIRDATFGEDGIRTKKAGLIRTMAAFLNLAINQLQKCNQLANLNITRENIAYDRGLVCQCFATG